MSIKTRLEKLESQCASPDSVKVLIPMPRLSQDEWIAAHAWCEKAGALFGMGLVVDRTWEKSNDL